MATDTVKHRKSARKARRRPWGGHARGPAAKRVVAEVLSDGTVRPLGEREIPSGPEWSQGQIAGDGWILWWQRRRLGM